jgi:hypothetical protein
LDKKRIHLYRMIIYAVIILGIVVTGYQTYQRWLNPLGLKPEASPKQHDGSQEFQGLREWESVIQPAPDEEGVRRYPQPQKKVDTEIER